MEWCGSTSHQGFELLDNELIDPTVVVLNMESWRHTEQSVKVSFRVPIMFRY
jgi:hypothetical protein